VFGYLRQPEYVRVKIYMNNKDLFDTFCENFKYNYIDEIMPNYKQQRCENIYRLYKLIEKLY